MSRTNVLNPRQKRFVEEYLETLNAEEAYRRAGYSTSGGTGLPQRMFALPDVRAAIEAGLAEKARSIKVDADEVIRRYAAIAFASIGDFVTIARGGALGIDPSALSSASLPALTAFDISEYRTPKRRGGERVRRLRIAIDSKLHALDALARHLGLFTVTHPATAEAAPVEAPAPHQDSVRPLNARRARFVDEYLRCGNATEAYIRAGHNASTAYNHAWRLMTRPDIRAAIEAGQRRLAQRFDVSAARVAAEYAKIGFANLSDFIERQSDGRGRLDLSRVPRDRLAALRSIVVEEYCDRPPDDPGRVRRARLTLAPKLPALDALARQLRLFDKKDPSARVPA